MATRFQGVAHRGGSQLAPENTLAAFRTALTLPIDAIELDVQMTTDGHAVVFHDYTVERLTDGTGNILDLDFAYLRSLNAAAHFKGGWPEPQRIPTLREILTFARGRTLVYIELKFSKRDGTYGRYPRIVETVVNEIRATKMLASVLVMSFDLSLLPLVKALEPSLQTGAIISNDLWKAQNANALEMLLSQATALGVNWLHMDCDLLTPEMATAVHTRGLKLNTWTANTLEEMVRVAALGVDSVTSDRPDLFAQARELLKV